MKTISVKAASKGWNARSVVSQSQEDFVKDPAHAIEGLDAAANKSALEGVYAKCKEAVEAADKAPEVAPAGKGKGNNK